MKILEQKKVHFIGIGGIGTSSLAQILFENGLKVSGSDNCNSTLISSLKRKGIEVALNHEEKNIKKSHKLIIYSPAIPNSNTELKKAKELGIKCLTYPQALGELTKEKYTIAIAGTHGKSTTTAMLTKIAIKEGLDPTVVIGTKMKELKNRNYRVGKSPFLIIEACEYKKSFHNFSPNILVITNIEKDHLDSYKTEKKYIEAFIKLAKKVPKDGGIIISNDDKNSKKAVEKIKAQLITWSRKKNNATLELDNDELIIELPMGDKISYEDRIKLAPQVPGDFNIENACHAAVTGLLLGGDAKKIERAIGEFKGTWRRFEHKKIKGIKAVTIDDYGHHPTEIKATLKAIQEEYPKKKVLCIFQPHQFSRTHYLLKDFGKSFKDADEVIIPDIYEVRDSKEDMKKVSTEKLVKEIAKNKVKVSDGGGLKETAKFIKKNHKNYDIIITMGAGDIDNIYKML